MVEMRRIIVSLLYQYGVRTVIAIAVVLIFTRWLTKEPALPDALVISGVDSMEFFEAKGKDDGLNGDGLAFTWAHAVNSQSRLDAVMKAQVHGIEADVVLKNEGTADQELLPIMAHPPVLRSDLTLRTFLHQTILGQAIIKLDFKSMASVELSLQLLHELSDQIKVPVWLNADVIRGPGDPKEPAVSAATFLMKQSAGFKHCTLSMGWTTSMRKLQPYRWSHVYEMYQALKPSVPRTQKVTFPINASLIKNSLVPLRWLCEQFDASLTLWQSDPEAFVDINELVYLRSQFPKNRVYYDLQPDTLTKFTAVADKNSSVPKEYYMRNRFAYKPSDWIIKVSDKDGSDLKVGESVVWLSGPVAQLTSVQKVDSQHQLVIRGAVSFISRHGMSYKANLQIFAFGEDHLNSHPTGIRCSIDSNGRMVIAADHVDQNKLYLDEELGASPTSCYQFELKISKHSIEFSASAPRLNCNTLQELVKPKTLKTVVDAKGLVRTYPIILRNSRNDGYAIVEQIHLSLKS